MSERHTKGTWICEKEHDGPFTNVGTPVAVVGDELPGGVRYHVGTAQDWGAPSDAEVEANAKLISASPSMLAALKLSLPYLGYFPGEPAERAKARVAVEEAIRKATQAQEQR